MSATSIAAPRLEPRSTLRNSFIWMTIGLIFTAIVAWFISQTVALTEFVNTQPVAAIVSLVAWVILALGFGFLVRRIPFILGLLLFFVYAAFTGLTLAWVFTAYTEATILYALVSTIGLFVVMTLFAMLTSIDLTRWWTHIIIGVIGIGLAVALNALVFQSSQIDLLLSIAGVGLFSISTAATVQKIARMGEELEPELHDRVSIIGAMMLYTNFINLFMRLLQIYGQANKGRR